jgi:linoleoyl-CoA desaturase
MLWLVLLLADTDALSIGAVCLAPLVVFMLLTMVAHPAGHGSFGRGIIGRLLAASPVLIGASPTWWHLKHVRSHHANLNHPRRDPDVQFGPLLRLNLSEPRRFFHRYQHRYCWLLYPFALLGMVLWADIRTAVTGRQKSGVPVNLRARLQIAVEKLMPFPFLFAIAVTRYGLAWSVAGYVWVFMAAGTMLAVVFQLNHCVLLANESVVRFEDWQASRTAEFGALTYAAQSRVVTSLLGGLNLHIEHHESPLLTVSELGAIARTRYPSDGTRYAPTAIAALRSHVRFMQQMGATDGTLHLHDGRNRLAQS